MTTFEVAADSIQKLRRQFTADFAHVFSSHQFTNRRHRHAVFVDSVRVAFRIARGGVRRIDENDPFDGGIVEVDDEPRRKFLFVVVEIIVLENGRLAESPFAIVGVVVKQRGNVAVTERVLRQIVFKIAGARRHIPKPKIFIAPPLADSSTQIIESFVGKFERRVKFARPTTQRRFGQAIHLLTYGDNLSRGRNFFVATPKVFVVVGIDELLDAFAAGHSEKDAVVVDEGGFAALDVGDEILGRFATVLDRRAEKTSPIAEDLIKILLVDFLLEIEQRRLTLAGIVYERGEFDFRFDLREVVDVSFADDIGVLKVVDEIRTRRGRFAIPIVVELVVEVGENFGREENGVGFRDDANVLAEDALIIPEFEAVNVVESLRDAFGTDLKIFQRRVEFELEENLLGVQVDKFFR